MTCRALIKHGWGNEWDPRIAMGTYGRCHEPHWLVSNEAVPAPIEDPEIAM